jgi:hypothetical protein
MVPDVALVADINTGGHLILNGQLYTVGGTSWGAPTWAGFCAMINQARSNHPLVYWAQKSIHSMERVAFAISREAAKGPTEFITPVRATICVQESVCQASLRSLKLTMRLQRLRLPHAR